MADLNALLHVSDQLLAEGIIEHPRSRPDRVSRIQVCPDWREGLAVKRTRPRAGPGSRVMEIAEAKGTTREVAERFGVTMGTVAACRSRYRRRPYGPEAMRGGF